MFTLFRLPLRQEPITKRILIDRSSQPSLHRVLRNIFPMLPKALLIISPHLRKPVLPNLALIPELFLQSIREPTLDQLHSLLNRHIPRNRNQQMNMIRHDYEVIQFEFPRRHIRPQNVDKKRGIPIGLQQPPPHAGFGCGEENPSRIENLIAASVTRRYCHSRARVRNRRQRIRRPVSPRILHPGATKPLRASRASILLCIIAWLQLAAALYQGMPSTDSRSVSGHGFSRAENAHKKEWALAPAG